MIRLSRPPSPYEIDLGDGVGVTVRPLTYAVYRASVHAAERMAVELAHDSGLIRSAGGSIHDIPDPTQREGFLGLRDQFQLQALMRHAILSWRGVLGEDGQPAPVTAETVDAFVRDAVIHAQRLEGRYLARIMGMLAEGEGSGAAPNGTSAAAPTTAGDAGTTETPAPTADGAPTASPALPA